jgi:hypothetical protein
MSSENACTKLNKYVSLRGEIAHRGRAARSCRKPQVEDYFAFIKRIVVQTETSVSGYVRKLTGRSPWPRGRHAPQARARSSLVKASCMDTP